HDHPDVRLGDLYELVDLALASHRHLEDDRLGAGLSLEQRQRQPDLRVPVLAVGVRLEPRREQRLQDVLRRGLAGRPGHADHRAGEVAPPGARQPLHRLQRVVRLDHEAAPAELARAPRPDHGAPGAGFQGGGGELAAVRRLPHQAHEEIAGARVAAVDHRPARTGHIGIADQEGGARAACHPGGVLLDHAPTPSAERSASRVTVTSSNGSFLPPSNSCPCSCPLPAITTTSPAVALPTARAIASRRSTSRSASGAPAITSSTIASGSSERGLSEVTITRSASLLATRAISGRFVRSRSPPAPNTTCSRPRVISRAARSTLSSASGVCA